MNKIFTGSWRTSLLGIALILSAVGKWLSAVLDNDPLTVASFDALSTDILAGSALLMARDNKVTSEQALAKQPNVPAVKLMIIGLLCLSFCGCAKFAGYTERKEFDDSGKVKSDEVTRFRGFTFLDSKANLTRAKALQTGKTQSVGVDTSAQESSGKTVSDVVDKLGEGLLNKAVTP